MRNRAVSAALSLVSAALLLFATGGCDLEPAGEVAVFGDSVSWGYGDLPGGWVRRVGQATGLTIANLAVPGERAGDAEGRASTAGRSAPAAEVVIVLHGGNDWIKAFRSQYCNRICDPEVVGNRYDDIATHLRAIRKELDRQGKRVVFLTYWPSSPDQCPKYQGEIWDAYVKHRNKLNSEIIAVAADHGDHVIRADDMTNIGGTKADFFDCLHPSAQGYAKIARRILADLDSWQPRGRKPAAAFRYVP